ncbi:MAG: IGHMBP2 family helicase [Candidatus Thermoplasmatota archaeon]|nr:IGHMBP2 family helicase [Candidatus Thermoplasmatota archaeon]
MSRPENLSIVEPGSPESISQKEYSIEEYVEHFSELVELERQEEMERHEREMKQLSGWERQKEGRAILNARARDDGIGLGGKFLVKFVRKDGLPEIEISVGDLVRISKNEPLSDDNPSGTVIEKTGYSLKAAFDDRPPEWMYDKVRIDLYVNDITYQRMLDALEKIDDLKGKKRRLIDTLLNEKDRHSNPVEKVYFCNRELNESQKEAVKKAIESEEFHLVHGPPGTGKTVTSVEIIEQAIEKEKEVLACADSNVAVDNLVEHLVSRGREVVRVGHPARVTPVLRKHTLDYILEKNDTYQKAQELREKAFDLKDKQDEYTYPSGRWRRGLSNEAIKSLAEKGKGSRGIPPQKIKEMAKSLDIQEDVDELFEKIDRLEKKAVGEVLDKSDVVCTTNSSSASQALEDEKFDLCVIDEATQATEPSCLIPAIKAEKLVMAGDHKQLPPTILNERAKDEGLDETMFERLIALYGDDIKTLLKIQYRMHEKIMRFSADEFYDGELIADETVKTHTLKDIIEEDPNGKFEKVLDPEVPISLIDTQGEMSERTRAGSTSKENPGEAVLAESLVTSYVDVGIEAADIGIITPYKDQADLIRNKVKKEELEIDTVDGFQGREKEVIVLSLTRSNDRGVIGFLRDLRRLNVSLTRAKRKLILLCDTETLSYHEIYDKLFDYVEKEGKSFEVSV